VAPQVLAVQTNASRDPHGSLLSTGATAHFTVTNVGGSNATFDYRLEGIEPESGGASMLLSLDGLPPGTPVDGSVVVPANGSADVSIGVSVDGYEPFLADELLLSSDLDQDTVLDPMVAQRIASAVDTTSSTVGVEPPVAGERSTRIRTSPNPFHDATEIQFILAETGDVQVAVFDLFGRRVRELIAGPTPAGEYHVTWNGRDDTGRASASGMYFVRLITPGRAEDVRVVHIR
jgi:hypothetical protein